MTTTTTTITDTLPNGVRVVRHPMPHLHTAHVALFVRVGSRDEGPEQSGLCHLLEHVLFRGCVAYPTTYAFNSAVESCCVGLDAATTREYTVFEASCEPAALPGLIGLIGAMIGQPLMSDIGVEKQVIAEELQDELDARGRDIDADNLAMMTLFEGHGLANKIGGRLSHLEHLDEAACRAWYGRHYVGSNMVLVVAGSFDASAVADAVRSALSSLPAGEPTLRGPAAEPFGSGYRYTRYKGGSQVAIHLAWAAPAEDHPDWPALQVAQRVLDDGSCARLRHRLVDQLGLAYHAGVAIDGYEDLSTVAIETETRPESVLPAIDAVLEVLAQLASEGPSDAELARAVTRSRFELTSLRDSPAGMAYWLGLQHLGPSTDGPAERAARLATVSGEDVRRAAAKHLGLERGLLTVVGDLGARARAAVERRWEEVRRRPTEAAANAVRTEDWRHSLDLL